MPLTTSSTYESHIYPNMCAIFGYGPTVVSREKGGTDTLTAGMNGYRITSMAAAGLAGDRSTVSGKHTRAFNGHSTDRVSQYDGNDKSKRRQREFIHSRLENVV